MRKLILLSLLLIDTAIYADGWDGNALLSQCKIALEFAEQRSGTTEESDWLNVGMCSGVITGVHDTVRLLAPTMACAPSMTMGEILRIVVNYLEDHPADLNHRGSVLVMQALTDAYPCD